MATGLAIGLPSDPETLRKFRLWFKIYGVLLIVLGAAAILVPGVATLATEILVGWLLVAGGILGLISVFQSGSGSPGFWWNLLTAILCTLAGIALLYHPVAGMVTLTIVLASYLLATGVSKIAMAFNYRAKIPRAWGWVLFSALVDIALGAMLVMGLPGTAIWAIGLLVGINLLFTGVALLLSAFYCPTAQEPPAAAKL